MNRSLLLFLILANMTCVTLSPSTTTMAASWKQVSEDIEAKQALQTAGEGIAAEGMGDLGLQTAKAVKLDENSSLQLKSQKVSKRGRSFRYVQKYKGVPIWNSEVIVRENKEGRVAGVTNNTVTNIASPDATPEGITGQPLLTPEAALQKAKEASGVPASFAAGAEYEREKTTLMYFLPRGGGDLRLSYHTTFFATIKDERGKIKDVRPVYIFDANTGETLYYYDNIQPAAKGTGPGGNIKTTKYIYGTETFPKFQVDEQGTICKMESTNVKSEDLNSNWNGPGTPFSFTCHDNTVRQANEAFAPLNDAQSFGQVIFDMYNDWYGASPLTFQLHLRVHRGVEWENANWNGAQMSFGDGKNTFYPLVSLDVTAHEVSHGFTEQNSGLIYASQSGGINEAFSDMAGEAAEYYFVSKYGKPFSREMPDFETGADIFKAGGMALRYMCDPPKDHGQHPDWTSIDHISDYYEGLDVHYSSGIYNKAFCLLSKRNGWNVKKAFDVFVEANQSYWVANETFKGGAEKVLKAAMDLGYQEKDVCEAFKPVGINLICDDGPDDQSQAKNQYNYTTLRVITNGANRGCSYNDWNCMTNLCKQDLGSTAWRGWAGCYRDGSTFQCYFECGQIMKLF